MSGQRRGGLVLPKYQRNSDQQRWVASKQRTAKLIQSLWAAAGQKCRSDAGFLCLLVQCGWTNEGGNKGQESTRKWRNQNIADYLNVEYHSEEQLAHALSSRFKALSFSTCLSLLNQQTGITHYYRQRCKWSGSTPIPWCLRSNRLLRYPQTLPRRLIKSLASSNVLAKSLRQVVTFVRLMG